MPSMSYCRFHNTAMDLEDCQEALERLAGDPEAGPLSREELAAAKRLARTCLNIVALLAEMAGDELEDVADDERRLDAAIDLLQAGAGEAR